jgi:sodium/hydrogen exchanger 8
VSNDPKPVCFVVNVELLKFIFSVNDNCMHFSTNHCRTLMSVRHHPLADHSLTTAVWSFLELFIGSLSTGVAVALICALLFKYAGLAVPNLHNLECCLIVLFPYFSNP